MNLVCFVRVRIGTDDQVGGDSSTEHVERLHAAVVTEQHESFGKNARERRAAPRTLLRLKVCVRWQIEICNSDFRYFRGGTFAQVRGFIGSLDLICATVVPAQILDQ